MKTKVCSKCGVEKPVTEFYHYPDNGPNRADRSPDCKECRCKGAKKYYSQRIYSYTLTLYYEGQVLQSNTCNGEKHKKQLLEMYHKMYGPRFKQIKIEYKQQKKQQYGKQHSARLIHS